MAFDNGENKLTQKKRAIDQQQCEKSSGCMLQEKKKE